MGVNDRPDLNIMPISAALPLLTNWVRPFIPPKIVHSNEKVDDASLVALAILRFMCKVPYFNQWWRILLTVDLGMDLSFHSTNAYPAGKTNFMEHGRSLNQRFQHW